MPCIHPFISEDAADLINSLQAAYYKSLQIKLQGYSKLHILIQCVVMSLKRPCRCPARIRHEHRCLDLYEISSVKEIPDLFYYL